MGKLFGTDGVRGIANKDLTPELAFKLGRAGAFVLIRHLGCSLDFSRKDAHDLADGLMLTKQTNNKPKILVGMDGRISGDMLEASLTAGLCSIGAHVTSVGILPTPAVAHLVREYNYDAGVVISASHNPAQYNGIKFFDGKGYKLPDALENEIEDIIFDDEKMEALPRPIGADIGGCDISESALDDYLSFLVSISSSKFDGMKVALDCANGASSKVAPLAFVELNAHTSVINNEPDGININKDCGSTHMEQLIEHVIDIGADIGFAFDGDADRCLAVDENGNLVDGDQLMTICGLHMKETGKLKDDTIVATVMSNLGFFIMSKEKGLNIEQTAVGDRYVLECMLEKGFNIGGEQSGHIIFLDHNTTGDGVLSAIKTLCVMKETGKKLSELAAQMTVLPQALVNAKVNNEKKYSYMEDAEIKAAIEAVERKYAGDGRVLIRTSGTEPLVRVMIEGKDVEDIKKNAEVIAKLIEEKLG